MINNQLKNPVWFALNETHKKYTINYNGVQFYDPNICPFGAFIDNNKTKNALNKYAELTDSFFLVSENETPLFDKNIISLDKKIECCQMILDNPIEIKTTEKIILLSEKHIDEIYNLVWLVMPGYFRKKTFEMGKYFGIFKDNKIVSIAGQRMQTNSFIEISAVVTHPEYTRKGFARQLTHHVSKDILTQEKLPILHTNKGNIAIKMYESLGFKITRDMNWWYFHKK
ncbi:GNAT family N-acetyltransferase [Tenacibaculum salmonis]|uniref:GNAT family N-acetyltransferase n=1 Tax=Tenacibaculum sp. P3-BQ1 TaxID=3232310 RepID=UPI0034DFBE8D